MGTGSDSKDRALAALRTWRTYMNDRDRLVQAARSAGATIAEIEAASGLAKGTVRSALAELADQEESMSATTIDPLAAYHHPNFISAEPARFGDGFKFTTRPFIGTEAKPERPEIAGWRELTQDQRHLLSAEYDLMRMLWEQARFTSAIRTPLEQAAPVWRDYATARARMEQAFTALLNTADGKWRAGALALALAQEEALAAAERWDVVAEQLAELEKAHHRAIGGERVEEFYLFIADAARQFGMTEVNDWWLEAHGEYQPPSYHYGNFQTPLVREVSREGERQNTQVQKADALGNSED